ncbi:hypothetical protein H3N56_03000 [Cetobacterium sp. 2A]|uniref:hypothetical protein n=1 Tax=Cetobacterium sp. 2A TaxID=2754723 RepID=UPI00163C2F06|nr:hypothetical protein [Cetobacterium sp. 2A]MBC2855462.1 hypothetical protein [Cetobacterium sp. 2A]
MLDSLMKNTRKVAKYLIGVGFIGALLLVGTLRGCSSDNSTNKHDAANTQAVVDGAVELKKTLDTTSIETKKLEMQDKSILDVNKSEEMKMQLEMKKLELIEAQKLKNEFEIEKLKMDNEALIKEEQIAEKTAKIKAASAEKAAKIKAAAAERARKEREEIEILKALAN